MTDIYEMNEKTGNIKRLATYSTEPKQSMINFIMQELRHNFNTWQYPENIESIRESKMAPNHFYYDDIVNSRVIAAYPSR
jgi:hypothetical protein